MLEVDVNNHCMSCVRGYRLMWIIITVFYVYYAAGRGGLLPTPVGGSPATPGGLHRQLSRLNSRDSGLKKGREVPYEVVIDGM